VVNRGTGTPSETQVPEISDQDVLDKVKEVVAYGYGRIEIIVREGRISTVNKTESLVRASKD
jgi:hypothetical protein